MTKVCTHAGLRSNENKLLIPARVLTKKERREGELSLDDEGDGLSGGDGSLVVDDLDFRTPPRPDSSTYGVTADDRLRFILRCWCSFSSSSISTSFISSPTPSSGDILRASRSIFTPKTRKRPAARKFVTDFGMRVGTAWPNRAERTVMVMSAEKAAVKTTILSWRIAMSAATRKVLSPTSEKRIMVKERRRECMGWMTALGSSSVVGREDLGFR
jgi:hypothetical protein